MATGNRKVATTMDPPLAPRAPEKAKKQLDSIEVKPPSLGHTAAHTGPIRGNALPRTPPKAKQSPLQASSQVGSDDGDSPDTPRATSPITSGQPGQLRKALDMLSRMRTTSKENLGIKNAVIAILTDLAAAADKDNQGLMFAPPTWVSTESQRITNVENVVKEINETMHAMKAMLAENNNKPLWSTIVASPANKTNSAHAQLQVEIAKRERLEQRASQNSSYLDLSRC